MDDGGSCSRRRLARLTAQLLCPKPTASSGAPAATPGGLLGGAAPGAPPPESRQEQEPEAWKAYLARGRKRALDLGNRGPIRFGPDGMLAQDIVDAYWRCGFYVFENVLSPEEVEDYLTELDEALENAPVSRGSKVDKHGRPVKYPGQYFLTAPGHEIFSPLKIDAGDRNVVVANIYHSLMVFDAALRLYGNPLLLRIAESINGPDFVPYTELIFIKAAGRGPPTGWHQDGAHHWDPATGNAIMDETGHPGMHGLSLHPAFTECDEENCLWLVPGTHQKRLLQGVGVDAQGKYPDIYTDWLEDAVPMLLHPGDVGMQNRNTLHGSYSNLSKGRRVTQQIGFHRRQAVLWGGETTKRYLVPKFLHKAPSMTVKLTYDEAHVRRASERIVFAIEARRQKYPFETPYVYRPLAEAGLKWDDQTRAAFKATDTGDEYWRYDQYL